MQSNHLITLSHEHLLINLVPSVMVMPGMMSRIFLDEHESSKKLLQAVRAGQSPYLFAVMSRPGAKEAPDRFYKTGVVAETEVDMENPVIILKGLYRAEMLNLQRIGNLDWHLWVVTVKKVEDENNDDYFIKNQHEVMVNVIKIRDLLVGFIIRAKGHYKFYDELMLMIIDNFENTDWGDKDAVDNFIWMTLHSIPDLFQKDKQPFLESTSLLERIELCVKKLKERLRLLEVQKQSSLKDGKKVREAKNVRIIDSNDQNQDEFVRGAHADIKKQWEKFKEIRGSINDDARKVIMEDFEKLKAMGGPQGNSYEWTKFMGHLKVLLGVPWVAETKQETDITKVQKVLDEDHYGLDHIKQTICDHVAPKILNSQGKGHIINFSGAPGVGKTSLGKSIARALNRPFIRLSLGGARDVVQIKGHDVTYIGSQPGEIIRAMMRCGYKNPVFILDEIDKVGHMTTSGDVSAALLEVLDPEQNNSFRDLYVDAPYDLSSVMFITTSNIEDNIIPPLRDRMEVISLPGYLEVEKIEIAKKHLIPRLLTDLGLVQNNVEVIWEEGLLAKIVRGYTSEAGVRNMERTLAIILRKICRAYLQSKNEGNLIIKFEVTEQKIHEYLGPPKFTKGKARLTKIGEAIGLAWTEVGGSILYVQSETFTRSLDKKAFARTGMQGNVMKEADEVAMTLVKKRLKAKHPELIKEWIRSGIHLHIPEGAIRKDGPSAGITVFESLYSLATSQSVKPFLAMTGEIDLKQNVMPVGGIREKVVAAERDGIKEIMMPKENERNLHGVPQAVKDKLKFHFVESVDQALEISFPSRS